MLYTMKKLNDSLIPKQNDMKRSAIEPIDESRPRKKVYSSVIAKSEREKDRRRDLSEKLDELSDLVTESLSSSGSDSDEGQHSQSKLKNKNRTELLTLTSETIMQIYKENCRKDQMISELMYLVKKKGVEPSEAHDSSSEKSSTHSNAVPRSSLLQELGIYGKPTFPAGVFSRSAVSRGLNSSPRSSESIDTRLFARDKQLFSPDIYEITARPTLHHQSSLSRSALPLESSLPFDYSILNYSSLLPRIPPRLSHSSVDLNTLAAVNVLSTRLQNLPRAQSLEHLGGNGYPSNYPLYLNANHIEPRMRTLDELETVSNLLRQQQNATDEEQNSER